MRGFNEQEKELINELLNTIAKNQGEQISFEQNNLIVIVLYSVTLSFMKDTMKQSLDENFTASLLKEMLLTGFDDMINEALKECKETPNKMVNKLNKEQSWKT